MSNPISRRRAARRAAHLKNLEALQENKVVVEEIVPEPKVEEVKEEIVLEEKVIPEVKPLKKKSKDEGKAN